MISTRIGNVAGAIVAGGLADPEAAQGASERGAALAGLASRLDGLFAETWLAGVEAGVDVVGRRIAAAGEEPTRDPGALGLSLLLAVLGAASAERVLVVPPTATLPDVEVLLALTAWPEREAVVFEAAGGEPACVLLRREVALERGRGGCEDLAALLASLDVDRVDRHRLGLEDGGFC